MFLALLLAFLLATLLAWTGHAMPSLDFQAIDRYVRAEMELNQIPGLSLAVVKGNQVQWMKAYGVSSLATGAPMTVNTPVELASVSKSLTALAVVKLQAEGRLKLDQPVQRYLPEFRIGDGRASGQITVRHLLEHLSGLSRREDYLVPCCGRPGDSDLKIAVLSLRGARLRRAPGSAFQYANSNYVLLAALIERLTGESFQGFMQARVFGPLELTRTTLDRAQALAWGLAEPHERRWGRVVVSDFRFSGWQGASQVKSTASDMGRYLATLLGGGEYSFALELGQLATSSRSSYYMGWFHRPRAEWLNHQPVLEHTGDIWGGNTAAILAPRSGLGVAVLLNAGVNRAGDIARGVLARAAGLPGASPGVAPWTKTPDNWAMSFTTAAALMLAALAARLRSAWIQFRRGERRFVWRQNWWQAARAVLLTVLAGDLVWLMLGGSRPPVSSLPTSLKVGIFFLGGVTAAVLVAAGVLGLAPRLESGEGK